MNEFYTPIFPRTISGKKYRLPLNDFRLEGIAGRMDALYSAADLSNYERGRLIKLYWKLERADRIASDPKFRREVDRIIGEVTEFLERLERYFPHHRLDDI